MSVFRIYPIKTNTIQSGLPYQNLNSSLPPFSNLIFGGGSSSGYYLNNTISRHLIQFDLTDLQSRLASFEINPNFITSFKLKLKNCIPSDTVLKTESSSIDMLTKNVATSFDLIAFPINKYWDEGKGVGLPDTSLVKTLGSNIPLSGISNWLSATTLTSWDAPGIFTDPTASTSNYSTQHFQLGSEDIDMDVTNIVLDWLSGGSVNNGFCIAYARPYELMTSNTLSISSFFTVKTNTAFKPYLEINYNQVITDDRLQVNNNRNSRLFLYLFSGETPCNYYSAGTVSIKTNNGTDFLTGLTPNNFSKGVYYVDVFLSGATKGQKYKDVWNNITFNPGYDQQNFSGYFEIKNNFFNSGFKDLDDYVVTLYGISNNDTLTKDNHVRVFADVKVNYTTKSPEQGFHMEFKLLLNNNVEIIPWTQCNSSVISNSIKYYFDINTGWLLNNQTYTIIIRISESGSSRILGERIKFKIVENHQ